MEYRPCIDAGRREDAGRDARAHARLADRDDRLLGVHALRPELTQQAERDVQRAGNVTLVPLGLLTDVEHLHGALFEQLLEPVDLPGYELGGRAPFGEVAAQLKGSDRT